jgi:hypothetical protein
VGGFARRRAGRWSCPAAAESARVGIFGRRLDARRQVEEQELERLRLRRHHVGLAARRERLAGSESSPPVVTPPTLMDFWMWMSVNTTFPH